MSDSSGQQDADWSPVVAGDIPEHPPKSEHVESAHQAAYSAVERLEKEGEWQFEAQAYQTTREARYIDPEEKYWTYTNKPAWVTVICSLLAVGLFIGQWWWPDWREAQGWRLPVTDGWIRFAMIMLGAYLAFLAWPNYRPKDWSAQEDEARAQASLEFHEKTKR